MSRRRRGRPHAPCGSGQAAGTRRSAVGGDPTEAGDISAAGGRAVAATLAVVLAFAGWEGMQQRDSPASRWGIAGSIAVVLTAALVAGRGRQQTSSTDWVRRSVGPLHDRRSRPRPRTGVTISHNLPTFSYLAGRITRWPWGRASVLATWLAVGSALALWNRTSRT
jgi:hypothetical protein